MQNYDSLGLQLRTNSERLDSARTENNMLQLSYYQIHQKLTFHHSSCSSWMACFHCVNMHFITLVPTHTLAHFGGVTLSFALYQHSSSQMEEYV